MRQADYHIAALGTHIRKNPYAMGQGWRALFCPRPFYHLFSSIFNQRARDGSPFVAGRYSNTYSIQLPSLCTLVTTQSAIIDRSTARGEHISISASSPLCQQRPPAHAFVHPRHFTTPISLLQALYRHRRRLNTKCRDSSAKRRPSQRASNPPKNPQSHHLRSVPRP